MELLDYDVAVASQTHRHYLSIKRYPEYPSHPTVQYSSREREKRTRAVEVKVTTTT